MKNLKPIGIPHSLLFEDLFARTFDSTKLDEDGERIRQAYQAKGYFTARVINHSEKVYDVYGRGLKIPIINEKTPGKRVDITMVVSRGQPLYAQQVQFRRHEVVPYTRPHRPPGFPHEQRRSLLYRKTPEGSG